MTFIIRGKIGLLVEDFSHLFWLKRNFYRFRMQRNLFNSVLELQYHQSLRPRKQNVCTKVKGRWNWKDSLIKQMHVFCIVHCAVPLILHYLSDWMQPRSWIYWFLLLFTLYAKPNLLMPPLSQVMLTYILRNQFANDARRASTKRHWKKSW